MSQRVRAVLEELQRLKREGVTMVSVTDEALEMLRASQAAAVTPGATGPVREARGPTRASAFVESSGENAAASFSQILAGKDKLVPIVAAPPVETAGTSSTLPPPVFQIPAGTKRERWEWLRQRVHDCPVCRAHVHGENKIVFGVGNIDADIFFCGEAPGAEEEIQGEPFVGSAGQLLNRMIGAMGLKRDDVYIGNILNWRPELEGRLTGTAAHQTGNRPPTPDEIKFGLSYLRAQVEVVAPKVIVALGSTAAEGLLGAGSFKSLGSVRGRWHTFSGTPLMITYHPSYLLHNESKKTKRAVWEDLLQVMEKVRLPISDRQRGFFV